MKILLLHIQCLRSHIIHIVQSLLFILDSSRTSSSDTLLLPPHPQNTLAEKNPNTVSPLFTASIKNPKQPEAVGGRVVTDRGKVLLTCESTNDFLRDVLKRWF